MRHSIESFGYTPFSDMALAGRGGRGGSPLAVGGMSSNAPRPWKADVLLLLFAHGKFELAMLGSDLGAFKGAVSSAIMWFRGML